MLMKSPPGLRFCQGPGGISVHALLIDTLLWGSFRTSSRGIRIFYVFSLICGFNCSKIVVICFGYSWICFSGCFDFYYMFQVVLGQTGAGHVPDKSWQQSGQQSCQKSGEKLVDALGSETTPNSTFLFDLFLLLLGRRTVYSSTDTLWIFGQIFWPKVDWGSGRGGSGGAGWRLGRGGWRRKKKSFEKSCRQSNIELLTTYGAVSKKAKAQWYCSNYHLIV